MEYCLRRIKRECDFEEWILYVSKNEEDLYEDYIIIFFQKNKSITYLLTLYPEQLQEEKYGMIIEGLYHDLGVCEEEEYGFELRVEKLPGEMEDEDLFDQYVQKKIEELRKVEKK